MARARLEAPRLPVVLDGLWFVIPPLPNTYWVVPGRLLAGEHPAGLTDQDTRARLDRLRQCGIDSYIDLTEAHEMTDYRPDLAPETRYLRQPIADMSIPDDIEHMQALQASIRESLARGGATYVHCRAGIGRTGLTIGCFLVEQGLDGKAALKQLNKLWRQSERSRTWARVPQTQEQAEYVRAWPKLRLQLSSSGAAT